MKPFRLQSMNQCIRQLATAVSNAGLYGCDHKHVTRLCKLAHYHLADAMESDVSLALIRIDDQMAVNGQALTNSLYCQRLARLLKTRGIGHLRFNREITGDELYRFVCALARRDQEIHAGENLKFGLVEVRQRSEETGKPVINDRVSTQILEKVSNEELVRIMEIYEAVQNTRNLHVVGLQEIVAEFIDIFSNYADSLLSVASLRTMDEYTFTHSMNVCLLNLAQASALGIEGPLLHDIGLSALLHDIGKLFIPPEILNKPDKLDEEEWAMIQEHPVRGAGYLVKTPGVPRLAVVNAFEHHMRFDLQGYPKVSQTWEQNFSSQMTSVSDVYDSLRTRRPYRAPMAFDATLDIIAQMAGAQLHPFLVEMFLKLMTKAHHAQEGDVDTGA